jgi:hypothetical protein
MDVDDDDELAVLKSAAAHAYQRARFEVIDQFPAGAQLAESDLSSAQLDAMRGLHQADAALAAYRRRQHRVDPSD